MSKFLFLTSVVIFSITFNSFIFQILKADSNSMAPTIQEGEFVGVYKIGADPITRGELIVFNAHGRQNILKRVIAVAGDTVVYENKLVYIKRKCTPAQSGCLSYLMVNDKQTSYGEYKQDGYPLTVFSSSINDVPFNIAKTDVVPEYTEQYFKQKFFKTGEWKVPEGHVFVLGDNRDHSLDSRHFGFVDLSAITGVAVLL